MDQGVDSPVVGANIIPLSSQAVVLFVSKRHSIPPIFSSLNVLGEEVVGGPEESIREILDRRGRDIERAGRSQVAVE